METIELRSEHVRKIIGIIPPILIRSGIGIIALILVCLIVAAAFIPYPEVIIGELRITDAKKALAVGELSYSHITEIKSGQKVEIELEGYDVRKYGYQHGIITDVSPKVASRSGKNFFSFIILLQSNSFLENDMKGKASIVSSNKTLLRRILDEKK